MREILDLIRLADVVDVVLVSALVYTAVVWLRRTQAGFAAIGLLLLGVLYGMAQTFDLRLTTWLFHSFFAILVIVIVVIFQEEIRQLFERLAVWSLRRKAPESLAVPTDILVHTLIDLAQARVGALVVLPGLRPIERWVRGGLRLDGVVSAPLLKSLFDPHSPGHDGAIIVEGDRITRFAAHLPLSTDFAQLIGVGTRHSAALGLAERTDALCLVVSEERGEVSVARDGRLRRLPDAAELTAVLADFERSVHRARAKPQHFWRQLIFEHWVEKVASFALVAGLWFALVPGSRPLARTFRVPVQVVNLPPELALESVEPAEVEVTLEGQMREFYLFNPRFLELTVDAALASSGRRTFQVMDDDLRYPKALTLEGIKPGTVKIDVRQAGPLAAPPQS